MTQVLTSQVLQDVPPLPSPLQVVGRALLSGDQVLDLAQIGAVFMTEIRVGTPEQRQAFSVALTVVAILAVVSSFTLRDSAAQNDWSFLLPLGFVTLGLMFAFAETQLRRGAQYEVCAQLPSGSRVIVHRTPDAQEAKLLCLSLERLAAEARR